MLAKKAEELAEEIAELAEALDKSVTQTEREEMLRRLEVAKRLLESMTRPQWGVVGRGKPGSGAGHVFTMNQGKAAAEAARALARQFWSVAVNAKKRESQLIEQQPSDAKFYELESVFFENTASLDEVPVEK